MICACPIPLASARAWLVDRIAELLDRAADPLARFGSDVLDVVEHPRHRDPRDAGLLGDIVDCRVSPAHARKLASVWRFATADERACQQRKLAPNNDEMEALSFRAATGAIRTRPVDFLVMCVPACRRRLRIRR